MTRPSLPVLAFAGSLIAFAAACSGDELHDWQPPTGAGGFEPGDGGIPSGSGSGTGSTGGGGYGGSGPPMCDDAYKRCDQLLTYPAGSEATVEVRGSFKAGAWNTGVPMAKDGAEWSALVDIPYNQSFQYKFVLDAGTPQEAWVIDPNNPNTIDDGFGGLNSVFSATTCDPWKCEADFLGDWPEAVLYFVFVDRFFNGDPTNDGAATPGVLAPADYQGGDWEGVRQKLDYLVDLGVNTLWLTVPMDNTEQSGVGVGGDPHLYSAYHGYWPERLDEPEERFGTMAKLTELVNQAHGLGMKVIVDYAMNHVHVSSPIYQQNTDWFWPLSDGTVNNCVCGAGCSWDGPEGKRCWFTDYLPDFDFTNAVARDFSVNNAIWWIQQTQIDGFRLDAVKHIEDQWLLDLRARVKSDIEPTSMKHFYMVGETFTGDVNLIKYYVDPATMLDGQFDFPLRMKIAASVLMRKNPMTDLEGFMNFNDNAYGIGLMSTFIGNHDMPRPIHLAQDTPLWGDEWAGGKELAWNNQPGLPAGMNAFQRLANAFTILFTTRGVPLVYYGDEIGLPGAGDPDNRRPMSWSGWSAGQTFLRGHVKKLAEVRKDHAALRRGTRSTVSVTADTYAYRMTLDSEVVYVAINRSDSLQTVSGLPSGDLNDVLNGGSVAGPNVAVPPRSARVLVTP